MTTSLLLHRVGTFLVVFAVAVSHGKISSAGDPTVAPPTSSEKLKLGASLFSKIRDSRQNLRSGIFEATESAETRGKEGKRKRSATIFCAFDAGNHLLRYDYSSKADETFEETLKYFRTVDKSGIYSPDTGYLTIMKPDGLSKISGLKPLDARLMGFVSRNEHRSGWTFEKMFALYADQALLTDVREETDGRFHLILAHGVSNVKSKVVERHVWIDPMKGYVPVRYQSRLFHPETMEWIESREILETTWSKQSDVWVPESVIARSQDNRKSVWELRLTWKSVNKEVPSSYFERQDLQPKPGTVVVDVRAGDPVVIERIAQDND